MGRCKTRLRIAYNTQTNKVTQKSLVGGWLGVKAILRIGYSNQKSSSLVLKSGQPFVRILDYAMIKVIQ